MINNGFEIHCSHDVPGSKSDIYIIKSQLDVDEVMTKKWDSEF